MRILLNYQVFYMLNDVLKDEYVYAFSEEEAIAIVTKAKEWHTKVKDNPARVSVFYAAVKDDLLDTINQAKHIALAVA